MTHKIKVYQTGTVNSLSDAVYDGDTSIQACKTYGDFGIGTFDLVAGELIACDNVYYRADAHCRLAIAPDHSILPYAVVCPFVPDISISIPSCTYTVLKTLLSQHITSLNYIYAFKIDAKFSAIKIRSESCQKNSDQKLAETLPHLENIIEETQIHGSLIGFWFPDYLKDLSLSAFHLHFINEERTIGGHMLQGDILHGTAHIQTLHSIQVDLIVNKTFAHADNLCSTDNTLNISSLE